MVKYKPKQPKANVNKNKANPIFFDGKTENIAIISFEPSISKFSKSAFRANPTPNGIAPIICQNVKIIKGPTRKYLHQLFLIFFCSLKNLITKSGGLFWSFIFFCSGKII